MKKVAWVREVAVEMGKSWRVCMYLKIELVRLSEVLLWNVIEKREAKDGSKEGWTCPLVRQGIPWKLCGGHQGFG